ncbi:hypothetical protein K461DRAFT_151531 [Myriangium duriaei CBS 260.36]|uniref:Uncharacterized protein n=1 Tax=Myriangium duriaei CBS 260.36 TaxID=1168546 RepID=A0A9P4MGZ3_9PEZI|nr:hypothetical protein K461DRAFT_151531 [Myriangium duriaei CBS 260.36]
MLHRLWKYSRVGRWASLPLTVAPNLVDSREEDGPLAAVVKPEGMDAEHSRVNLSSSLVGGNAAVDRRDAQSKCLGKRGHETCQSDHVRHSRQYFAQHELYRFFLSGYVFRRPFPGAWRYEVCIVARGGGGGAEPPEAG